MQRICIIKNRAFRLFYINLSLAPIIRQIGFYFLFSYAILVAIMDIGTITEIVNIIVVERSAL